MSKEEIEYPIEEELEEYMQLCKKLQQENKQLKDKWNGLKEYIISTRYSWGDEEQDNEDYDLTIEDVLTKMLELEKSDSK